MKYTKKIMSLVIAFTFLVNLTIISNVFAETSKVDSVLSSMSNEDKIAQMIMPAFRGPSSANINNDNVRDIISTYGFAGVILFAENTPDIETTMRFVDLLQDANKNNSSRLLIGIDQEGGYVTRLGIGTNMPGNMALAATNNPNYAYNAAKTIGHELKMLGINTNFAPVVDVNSDPANPAIGIRAFSDDPSIVATYGEKFMEGLQSEGLSTSLKHFPGHGSTKEDTHTKLAIVDKNYNQLKNNDLIPFQRLITRGTDMIMTAHIQFPNIETNTYISKKDGEEYTLPATLSKKILTDILRGDMGYNGIIVTDALDMKAISEQFGKEDASIRAINAGADILLMPYTDDSKKEEFKTYIQTLASKVGTEIDEDNVNASVKRILKLKEEKGLLEEYDNSNLEENIVNAKNVVSSKKSHNEEFEMAKKAITMIKNNGNVLPLNGNDKTVVVYEYGSHIKAISNALNMLTKNGTNINKDNVSAQSIYDDFDLLKEKVNGAKNVIMIHSLYEKEDYASADTMNKLVDYVHKNNGKVILLSAHFPYNVAKFKSADAIVLTYLANGIRFDLDDYEKEIPQHGPNVIAGIYMLFTKKDDMNGILPVNLYNLDSNDDYTNEIIYKRGFGLKYSKKANTLIIKAKTKKVKYSNVKKKKQVVSKAIKVYKSQGKVTYSKQKGSSEKLTINKKSGNITIKKGTKKGTYKIKVKVTASGNENYKSGYKIVVVTIKVK